VREESPISSQIEYASRSGSAQGDLKVERFHSANNDRTSSFDTILT
jgi:hypothetical protein